MARRPTPTRAKELRGNPGKRPYNKREPMPRPFITGAIPRPLLGNRLAIEEWQRLAPILADARMTTEGDRTALVSLCLEWSKYLKAGRNAARENYRGRRGLSHWFSVERHALQACIRLWVELGLTPSSRSRVVMAETPPAGGDTFTEFDQPPGELDVTDLTSH